MCQSFRKYFPHPAGDPVGFANISTYHDKVGSTYEWIIFNDRHDMWKVTKNGWFQERLLKVWSHKKFRAENYQLKDVKEHLSVTNTTITISIHRLSESDQQNQRVEEQSKFKNKIE